MDFEAQPVPPIFQPEIIANAIFHTALHPKREVLLGWPTVKAVLGQEARAGLRRPYLARHIDAQYTKTPRDPNRPRNLFEPVAGHHQAHGAFDDRAKSHSLLAPVTTRLGAAGVMAVAGVVVAATSLALLHLFARFTRA